MTSTKPLPGGRGLPQSIRAATVIGLGGVGRCVAMQLAALRVPRLLLVDPGNLPRTKYAADGFPFEDAGRARAHTTAQLCHQIYPQLDLNSITERSVRRVDLGDAVFCCRARARTGEPSRAGQATGSLLPRATCGRPESTSSMPAGAANWASPWTIPRHWLPGSFIPPCPSTSQPLPPGCSSPSSFDSRRARLVRGWSGLTLPISSRGSSSPPEACSGRAS